MLSSNQKMVIVIALSMLCLFGLKKHFSSKQNLLKQQLLEQQHLESDHGNAQNKDKKLAVVYKKSSATIDPQGNGTNSKDDIQTKKNHPKTMPTKKDTSRKESGDLDNDKKDDKPESTGMLLDDKSSNKKLFSKKEDAKRKNHELISQVKLRECSTPYKVQENDKSLWDISRKGYKIYNEKMLNKIVLGIIAVNEFHKKNIRIFKNDNFNLQVGEIIRLPSKDMLIALTKKQIASFINAKTYAPAFHIIQEGDNLVKVAKKFSKRLTAILNANPDLDPDVLSIGTLVYVPD